MDFATLLAPIEPTRFFEHHWEQAPLSLLRGERTRYAELLTQEDVEFVLRSALRVSPESVSVFANPPDSPPVAEQFRTSAHALERLHRFYAQGASIRLLGIQRHWRPVWKLCQDLERAFNCPIGANLYWTPPESQAIAAHYDTHSVFILQISGRKQWTISHAPVEFPVPNARVLPFDEEAAEYADVVTGSQTSRPYFDGTHFEPTEPICHPLVDAGDLLYIPRGYVHEARATETPSIHLTISINALTWADLLSVALQIVAHRDPRLRRALPVGFVGCEEALSDWHEEFSQLLRTFADSARLGDALLETTRRFIDTRQRAPGSFLTEIHESDTIDLQTRVGKKSHTACRIVVEQEAVTLLFSGNWFRGPRGIEEPLRSMLARDAFAVGSLPGNLTDSSKLVLVRRLIKAGFLQVLTGTGTAEEG